MHGNPVKRRLTPSPDQWPWSSFSSITWMTGLCWRWTGSNRGPEGLRQPAYGFPADPPSLSAQQAAEPLLPHRLLPAHTYVTRLDGTLRGNCILKTVPSGPVLSTPTWPPCSWTIFWTTVRPKPMPFSFP